MPTRSRRKMREVIDLISRLLGAGPHYAQLRPGARSCGVARPHLHLVGRARSQSRERRGPGRPLVLLIGEVAAAADFPVPHVIIGDGRPGILRLLPLHRQAVRRHG